MENTSLQQQLLEAGVHFGHLKKKWNPKMLPYIFAEKKGIHIIDLNKTVEGLQEAAAALKAVARSGKKIMFVATKKQAKEIAQESAKRVNMPFVTERWLGGMLTNFSTIRKSIKRLASIDKMEADGTFEKFTKKERLMLNRERERLRRVFGGIEEMTRIPGAIFVVDVKKEHIAIQEAKKLGIPVIGMVDTNCDPDTVNYPIPANDDSIRTIELIAETLAESVLSGREIAKQKAAEAGVSGAAGKDNDSEDDGKGPRKMRPRRRKDDEAPRSTGDAPAEA